MAMLFGFQEHPLDIAKAHMEYAAQLEFVTVVY